MSQDIDLILDKLAKDVESAVHSLYRGEVRQETAKARTGHLVSAARASIASALGEIPKPVQDPGTPAASPRPSVSGLAVVGDSLGWSTEEGEAVLRCINAWLPMGGPAKTPLDTKCISAGKMLVPSWGEREKAREAVRRVTSS